VFLIHDPAFLLRKTNPLFTAKTQRAQRRGGFLSGRFSRPDKTEDEPFACSLPAGRQGRLSGESVA